MKEKLLINVTQSLIKHFKKQNYNMLNEWLGRTFLVTSRHSLSRLKERRPVGLPATGNERHGVQGVHSGVRGV